MQPSKIYYERNFPLNQPFLFEKYGMEVTINPGEDPEQAYAYAIEAIEGAHKANNREDNNSAWEGVTDSKNPAIVTFEKPIPAVERIQSLINDIKSCKELIVLESYKLIVKATPDLQPAYDEMLKKLS